MQNASGQPITQGTAAWRAHRAKSEAMLDNRIGYAGYLWDPWLKVYHVRHRVYMPGTQDGRDVGPSWLQPDPIGIAGGLNLYEYCNGDPMSFVDPMGLSPWTNRLENALMDAGAGLGDGLSIGITGYVRHLFRLNDRVDSSSGLYRASVAVGAAVTITVTAGAAAPTALTTVTGGTAIGALSGGASNIVSQKTQFDQGYRTSFDATEFATETAFGGVFGGVFNGVLNAARILGAGARPTVTGVLNGQRTGAAAAGGAAVTECGASAGAGTEKAALQKLITAAEGRFAKEGLTIRQEFRATLNPKLEPAFRGERMDHFFRQAFEADPVPGLELTPRGVFGPDVRSLSGRHWYDLTTPQAWNAHLRKYSPRFGTDGRPLHYNP